MVRGLALFKEYFKDHADKYVLIGGTACDISLESLGLHFRATKDLDIVLILEALDAEFAKVFWDFIKKGKYKNIQKSTGKKLFYRFYDPEAKSFPYMLELFSRVPDFLQNEPNIHLAPIPFDDGASSLSAILLNDEFYCDFSHLSWDLKSTSPPAYSRIEYNNFQTKKGAVKRATALVKLKYGVEYYLQIFPLFFNFKLKKLSL